MTIKEAQVQKAELQKQIWDMQNHLRGGMDGWDFKNYILGLIFYRFLSDEFTDYMNNETGYNAQKDNPDNYKKPYQELSDEYVLENFNDYIKQFINDKGYFILPSQLFSSMINLSKNLNSQTALNEKLAKALNYIEASAVGYKSENDLKGLFDDIDVQSPKLGPDTEARQKKLDQLLTKIGELDFDFTGDRIDVLGDIYEWLIGQYASSAGKKGGEFFTPQEVSELLTKITVIDKLVKEDGKYNAINEDTYLRVYDPTCGSAALLLRFAKEVGKEHIDKFNGQELNPTTYNLARMNMFLHGVRYNRFNIYHGDTLTSPSQEHKKDAPYDAIVSNPPYSIKWEGADNAALAADPRFTPAGVLAPKGKADLAFVMHSLSLLSEDGVAAIVEFPTVLTRSGAEQKIRKYLVDNNFVDTIIHLPKNLFFGTSIDTCIIVLKKNKSEKKTLFINASRLFEKGNNQNIMTADNLETILDYYSKRNNVEYKVALVDNTKISENDYNLGVNTYVETENTKEIINIENLEAEIEKVVDNINNLRTGINSVIDLIKPEVKNG